jgi:peptidylprolyl isomerase
MTDFSKSAAFAAAILTDAARVERRCARAEPAAAATIRTAGPTRSAGGEAKAKGCQPATPADPATPQRQTSAQGGEVVARVGGRDISTAEVQAFLAGMAPDQRAALAKDPAMLSQALRIMLANQLVLKEANDKNWQDQPAVAAQLAKLRDDAIIAIYLQSVSIPPANYPDEAGIQENPEANKRRLSCRASSVSRRFSWHCRTEPTRRSRIKSAEACRGPAQIEAAQG